MPSPSLERELRLVEERRAAAQPKARLLRLSEREVEAAIEAELSAWRQQCPACGEHFPGDAGFVEVAGERICAHCARPHLEAERAASRRARLSKDRARALEDARVPVRFLRPFIEPERWPQQRDGLSLADWPGDPWAALLVGPVGAGKTYFGVELLWRALLAGQSAAFVRAAEIPALSIGNAMPVPDLLLVDDLGLGHSGGGWEVVSRELLGRYDAELPTVITTRLRPGGETTAAGVRVPGIVDFDASLGDRLRDGLVFAVNGPSRRGQ